MRLVIPSVNYADFLAVTLPRWQQFLPDARIVVVTAPGDESIEVARQYEAEVYVTDIWTRQIPTKNKKPGPVVFNKSAALDEAFGFKRDFVDPPPLNEICLAIDCDVVPYGKLPVDSQIRPRTLYGCPRYYCNSPEELTQADEGLLPLKLIPPKLRGQNYGEVDSTQTPLKVGARCLGYFQLFRYYRGLHFGSYRTAGGYDTDFRYKFQSGTCLKDLYVLHLGEQDRGNWKGRVVKPWGVDA